MASNLNWKEAQEIFCTGSHSFRIDEKLLQEICFLIEEGYLNYQTRHCADKNKYQLYVDTIERDPAAKFDLAGGSVGHMSLKLIGRDLMHGHGYTDTNILFEQNYLGCIPDVLSADKSLIVECGQTNPNKISLYFKEESLKELVVIPYPRDEDIQISSHHFFPGENLKEFLDFAEKERVNSLGKIINSRRNRLSKLV